MSDRRRVAVVTGGGGGIGAAVAEAIARTGAHVVTMDPLVSLDGSEQLPAPEETTAGRIVAAGRSAEASNTSVTDTDAVRELFERLAKEYGGLDAVVNVAGISRPTGFAKGSDEDWRSVLTVHLDGYLNVLRAALPLMVDAGRGHIVGVTSGSGWRAADAGAYSCAKRAVAALTWQLGAVAPPGVIVNAMSPIAVTRMVTAALGRATPAAGAGRATGGLSLGSMPEPEQLGPLAAHLVDESFAWCRGRVVFAGGSEAAIIDEPRLLEVVRTDNAASLPHLLEAVTELWAPVEAQQASTGGSNPRLTRAADEPAGDLPPAAVRSCAVVADDRDLAGALGAALAARGVECTTAVGDDTDAVIVAHAAARTSPANGTEAWERVLAEHDGIVEAIHRDASATRAVADRAIAADRPVRVVTLTDASTAGGRSRAQAAAQLSRAARGATDDRVAAFAVSVESGERRSIAEIAAHLACSASTPPLAGAELAVGAGWFGVRSHPRVRGSVALGGTELPAWFDTALRELA